MRGNLDTVRADGRVEGWCWNEESPDSKISVAILVDGVEVGRSLAGLYRPDLGRLNIGDGFHAFSFVPQTVPRKTKRIQTYTLVEAESRARIGPPLTVHNTEAITFDDRLAELEECNRLLATRLEELCQREERSSSIELFSIVGDFFTQLSKNIQSGQPLGAYFSLRETLNSVTHAHSPLTFAVPDRPSMTILVQAGSSLGRIHECLVSLQRAGAEAGSSVVVIDTGKAEEAALVPSIVRGIRYVRTVGRLTAEWAEAEHADNADLLLMLSDTAVLHEDFLREVVETFAHNPRIAAVGGHVVNGGQLLRGGFCIREGTLKDCVTVGHPEVNIDLTASYPVHALSYQGVAFRRGDLRAVGGIDTAFGDDLGSAIVDLCFRLRKAGKSIVVQPHAKLEIRAAYSEDTWLPSGLAAPSHAGDLVRTRWLESEALHARLVTGHAAIISTVDTIDDDLTAARVLHNAGYSVVCFGVTDFTSDQIAAFQRAGSTVEPLEDPAMSLHRCSALLVYAAAPSSILEQRPIGSEVALGLAALHQLLSNEVGATPTLDAIFRPHTVFS